MPFNLDIINILILVVIVLNSTLGLFIFTTKKDNAINQNFFIFSIAATFWGISMFLYRGFNDPQLSFLFARILYVSAATIPFIFLFFIRVFPQEKHTISKNLLYVLAIPFVAICVISILPNYLIYSTSDFSPGEKVINFSKFYHTIYALYITGYFSICYFLLIVKYVKFKGIEKIQITYVILGTFISTIIGVCTNLIMPYLGDFSLNWLGQVGIIVMVSSISYSILQYKLFEMRVVATQFIVFVLCTSLFARVLFSSTKPDFIINMSFLVITVIISFLLLRSVIHEVEQRQKIEKLAADLEHANMQQESLIHFITHQIKGFFAKSRDIYSMVLEGDFGNVSEALRPIIQEGLDSETKGVALVKEILDSANLKKGTIRYTMAEIDFKKLVTEIVAEQKKIAEQKGLRIETHIADGDCHVVGDGEQLNHVVRNIIDNSIKYTPTGKLTVSLSHNDQSVLFVVKDTGVGVTEEDRPQLFTAGGKGKNSIKVNVESTGFGLFIVKEIVDAHKGRIWVDSDGAGKGSTFYVELPKK